MSKRQEKKNMNKDIEMMKKAMEQVIDTKFKSILHDITYRMNALYDEMENRILEKAGENPRNLTSGRLNLAEHLLEGFVFTDDDPAAGSVSWSDCSVVYKGTTHTITDGDTTDKYIYWELSTPGTFQTSATKPSLGDDDILVAINDNGTHSMNIGIGRVTHGATMKDGTIGNSEIGNDAVNSLKILDNAVNSSKIDSGAVGNTQLGDGAVTSAKIGTGEVAESNIGTGAVTDGKIGTGAVTNAKIGSEAVDEGKIGTGAVTNTKLGNDSVTSGKIGSKEVATGNIVDQAVGSLQIGNQAVGSGQLGDGSVLNAKIGAGEVATNKLNTAQHMLF